MEFTKAHTRLRTLKSLLAVLSPVVIIWCLFSMSLVYREALINRIPAKAAITMDMNN